MVVNPACTCWCTSSYGARIREMPSGTTVSANMEFPQRALVVDHVAARGVRRGDGER
jgi:hypothetical protein